MASVGKIGHTDASQESEQEPVFSLKVTSCSSINHFFNENTNTLIPNHAKYTLTHKNTTSYTELQSTCLCCYHLIASAVNGRAEDTALLEGRCSQALNELLVLDTLHWISFSSQLERMRLRTTSLTCPFRLMVNTVN